MRVRLDRHPQPGRYAAARSAVPTPLAALAIMLVVAGGAAMPLARGAAATLPATGIVGSTSTLAPTTPAVALDPEERAHPDAALISRVRLEQAAAEAAAELAALTAMPDATAVPTAVSDPALVLSSGFVRPVEGPITSPFGLRLHPITHVWKLHSGTDIGAACGTPVKAAKDGTVEFAGGVPSYGNRVVLQHDQGLETTYNHLTAYAATAGLAVKQGQIIGYVGTTGSSTGCHLHFEVKVNGAFVDPNPYLDLAPSPKVTIPPAVKARSDAVQDPATDPLAILAAKAAASVGMPVPTTAAPLPTSADPTTTAAPTESTASTTSTDPATIPATTDPGSGGPSSTDPATTSEPAPTTTEPTVATSEPPATTSAPSTTSATHSSAPSPTTPDPSPSDPTPSDPSPTTP